MKTMKQILAGFLVVAIVLAGVITMPMKADATETTETVVKETINNVETGVIYVFDETNYKFSNYWSQDTKSAPVREDFVFGGWYTSEDGVNFTAIKQTDAEEGKVDNAKAWAKFVPTYVLSLKAQLDVNVEEQDSRAERGYLRLLSAVNGTAYQSVGFDIWYNKRLEEENSPAITKVFSSITNAETGSTPYKANDVFGTAATHFSVLRLDGIGTVNYGKVIYVTPHWTTLDGTTVYGQAKYVRVMDGFEENKYISIPVNLLTGSPVAAGQLNMAYDTRLEVVEVDGNGYDAGVQVTEASHYDNKTGTIKFVNNIIGTANIEPESVIYANVWFKVKADQSVTETEHLKFTMSNLTFCNWEEDFVTDVAAWDVQY